MSAPTVELRNLIAAYADTAVLRDVSLTAQGGELLAVLGPSGCGKTTLLRTVAGLLPPVAGQVIFNGEDFTNTAAEARAAAVVFQKPLLFPHLTVAENVAFGLKMRGVAKPEMAHRVDEALEMVELAGYQQRRPSELSGGQEQRVSLARALVTRPRVLLLDEPFSALDAALRLRMRSLVRDLQRRLHLTAIFVTHDQDEAAFLADRVALLLEGGLEQVGTVDEVYSAPSSARAARFLRWIVLDATRTGDDLRVLGGASDAPRAAGEPCTLAVQPQSLRFADDSQCGGPLTISAAIHAAVQIGSSVRYVIQLASGEFFEVSEAASLRHSRQPGDVATFQISREAVRLY